MDKIFLIDGNHLVHRSFHAIKPLFTSKNQQTNAIFGFFSIILNLIEKETPQYLLVTFDEKAPTFRHIEYKEYKATRKKAPDELYQQIPIIKEILEAFQIPIFSKEGFEADDLLGTFAHQSINQGLQALIVTGDHDAFQLVEDDKILVITPHKGYREPIIYNEQKVQERYGISPQQITDYKGICGDASDNLKGVQGIGHKGAQKLLQKYETVENVYNHIDEIHGKEKEKLIKDKDSAFKCKQLAKILTDVPLSIDIKKCRLHDFNPQTIEEALEKYELFSIKNRLKRLFEPKQQTATKADKTNEQMRLF